MQLGHTIPLQKYLKIPLLSYGASCDLFFCWELHRIILQSRETMVAVNANNRFAIVLCGMDAWAWKNYVSEFTSGLEQAMDGEGYTGPQIRRYMQLAGKPELTKTHGRRSVSGLNQMDNDLWSIPVTVKNGQLYQPVHCHEVNRQRCKMAGYDGCHVPSERFEHDMVRMGILHRGP